MPGDFTNVFGVVIPSGGSLSNAIRLGGLVPFALAMPPAWTAAAVTFSVSQDGTDYLDLYDDAGVEVSVTAAAGRMVVLDPAILAGQVWVKIRSGTAGAPVNQGAERLIGIVVRSTIG